MYIYDPQDNIYEKSEAQQFGYQDANAAEERIYKLIKSCQDRSLHSPELKRGATDWPTYYHLTPLRANLMRPFAERIRRGTILELGAGCGAVTRYLGELGGQVTALEGSRARAQVIGRRCADLPNVKVYCDLIQNIEFEEKFDIVTLIGVLEYAQVYVEASNPIQALLDAAKKHLKEGGILIVAIENQLGLKYFSGCPEDHMGHPMYGINDSYGTKTPITFGKHELQQKILQAGFSSIDLFLPFPDYKTPVTVIYPRGHDLAAAPADWNLAPLLSGTVVHDRQRTGNPHFSQEMAWQVVARNGIAADLANSFLMVCHYGKNSDKAAPDDILAAHYGGDRPYEFGKETVFIDESGKVVAKTHKNTMQPGEYLPEPYETGKVWFDALLKIVNRPNWHTEDIVNWASPWGEALKGVANSIQVESLSDQFKHFPLQLPGNYVDATPTNFIVNPDGSTSFFDLEWELPFAVPLEFVLFRGLFLTLHRVTSCSAPAKDVPANIGKLTMEILSALNVHIADADLDNFVVLFNSFQNFAVGLPHDALNSLTSAIEKAVLPIRSRS